MAQQAGEFTARTAVSAKCSAKSPSIHLGLFAQQQFMAGDFTSVGPW
jgi:hypothetical protein